MKSKISVLLLICIVTLVLIPVIFELSGYREAMTDYVNFTDYNTIDRIQVNTSSDNPTYSYCMGGTVKCNTPTAALIDISNSNYNNGKTYKSTCNDGSDAICSDNLFSSVVSYNLPYYTLQGGTMFPLSTTNKGFTNAYDYLPVEFDSSDNFNIYNNSKIVMEKIHKCNLLSYDNQANCYKKFFMSESNGDSESTSIYTSDINDDTDTSDVNGETSTSNLASITTSSTYNETTADTSKCNQNSNKIPCIADYGTNVGENLCCGQTGVLQNTKYVCPITRPSCSNFKCGTQFGNCV